MHFWLAVASKGWIETWGSDLPGHLIEANQFIKVPRPNRTVDLHYMHLCITIHSCVANSWIVIQL